MTKKSKNLETGEIQKLKRTISSLKAKLRHRDKKIDRLISDIKTYKSALDKSIIYINKELENIPVEDIVRYFSRKKAGKLNGLKDEQVVELNKLKEKWRCFKCHKGYLRLVVLERQDGQYYFRSCVSCDHRTDLKPYSSEVEGVDV